MGCGVDGDPLNGWRYWTCLCPVVLDPLGRLFGITFA